MQTATLPETDSVVAPLALGEAFGLSTGQVIILALALICLTWVMLSTRRRIRRSAAPAESPISRRYAEIKERRSATRGVEQVMLELDELSRQIHGRLDTKLARLEAVIHDADQRIDKLSRVVKAARGVPSLEVTLEEERPEPESRSESVAAKSRYAAVYDLADSGKSPVQIAEVVGKTSGEIELILSLRKAKERASSASDTSEVLAKLS